MSTRRSSFDGMSRTNQARQEKKNKKDRRIIRNSEPSSFEETYGAKLTDMRSVEDSINQVFKLVFEDWHGCKLKFDQNGQLALFAYFKPIGNPSEGSTVAFKKIVTDAKSEGLLGMAMSFKELNKGNNFKMTADGAEYLYGFLTREAENVISDWEIPEQYNKLTIEMADPTNGPAFQQPQGSVLIEMGGLDISKILGLIYGTKGANGSRCIYEITCNRIKSEATMYQNNWILTIMRMDEEHYREAMVVAGYSGAVSTFDITTV